MIPAVTPTVLRTYTAKDLAKMARAEGLAGWHDMRKDELVDALVKALRRKGAQTAKRRAEPAAKGPSRKVPATKNATPKSVVRKPANATKAAAKSGLATNNGHPATKPATTSKLAAVSFKSGSAQAPKPATEPVKQSVAPQKNGAATPQAISASKSNSTKQAPRPAVKTAVARTASRMSATPKRPTPPQIDSLNRRASEQKNLATVDNGVLDRDRLVVMVRDPYWLHAVWELSPRSVERAQSALGPSWHAAKPVLRLFHVADEGGAKPIRQIEIHGGVRHWYIDVAEPPRTYRIEIGYATTGAQFFSLARSNTVSTPAPGSADMLDRNWADVADNADRIYAMSGGYSAEGVSLELQELLEERLRRKLGRPADTRFGAGAGGETESLKLALDAELIVFGSTSPHAHVTVQGEPAEIRPDGSFAVKVHLPERRQVIPVVASSSDGVEQKTVILGIERNTKVLEVATRETRELTTA